MPNDSHSGSSNIKALAITAVLISAVCLFAYVKTTDSGGHPASLHVTADGPDSGFVFEAYQPEEEQHTPAPDLSCFSSSQCMLDKAVELQDGLLNADNPGYYGNTLRDTPVLFLRYAKNDRYIRRKLTSLDEAPLEQISAKYRLHEQLRLAALLDDRSLLERYLLEAKQLLQAPTSDLSSDDLAIKRQWLQDASGTPNISWLEVIKGEHAASELVADYVREGLKESAASGWERLQKYHAYLGGWNESRLVSDVLKVTVSEQHWEQWQQLLNSYPKRFSSLIDAVEGHDYEGPVLPANYVPWTTLRERILAATSPRGFMSDMYAYLRFASRDLPTTDVANFLDSVTLLDTSKKADYASYFVQQSIRHQRLNEAKAAIGRLISDAKTQQRLLKKIDTAQNPPTPYEKNFSAADYRRYVDQDPALGPCLYLQDLVEDSSSYLLSSSHYYLAKKRIEQRADVFEKHGTAIEASCRSLEKPCEAVYYLHKLAHYGKPRRSIVQAMIDRIEETAEPQACGIYFMTGQLPFVNQSQDVPLFENILSIAEDKLQHPMPVDGYRGLSDEYQLYARGITDSLFAQTKQKNAANVQRLLQLVEKDQLQTYLVQNDFPHRLTSADDITNFNRNFEQILTLVGKFSENDQQRRNTISYLLSDLANTSKDLDEPEEYQRANAKFYSLLTRFEPELADESRHNILSALLTETHYGDIPRSKQQLNLLVDQALRLKLTSIEEKSRPGLYLPIPNNEGTNLPAGTKALIQAIGEHTINLYALSQADGVLVSLLRVASTSGHIQPIQRIAPLFKSSGRLFKHHIELGMSHALNAEGSAPNPMHALALYRLLPESEPDYWETQNTKRKSKASGEERTLSEQLSRLPDSYRVPEMYCQLVKGKHNYEAEQLLLAKPDLYGATNDANHQLCSLELATALERQTMVDELFRRLETEVLTAGLLAKSAELNERKIKN